MLLVLVVAGGCAIKLAPAYDKTILDGLSKVNEDGLVFFASISAGTTANSFDQRQATYSSLIGRIDALRLQSKARPAPRLPLQQIDSPAFPDLDSIELLDIPTTSILATLVGTMASMRDHDKRVGMRSMIVDGFKRRFEISMDQALTYEKALER